VARWVLFASQRLKIEQIALVPYSLPACRRLTPTVVPRTGHCVACWPPPEHSINRGAMTTAAFIAFTSGAWGPVMPPHAQLLLLALPHELRVACMACI
jgi:hypothetical protein